MKFAVISDIHGNIVALRAALAEIARAEADRILVLGDLFGIGHVRDILAALQACNALIIRGNHEGYQLSQHRGEYGDEWARYDQFAVLREIHAALAPDDFRWLAALPEQISLRCEDISLRMVHGSPRANNENLLQDEKTIRHALGSTDERIILCGHNHERSLYEQDGRYICNAGSVGENFDPAFTADVTFITCEAGDVSFDQRRVPYDFEAWRPLAGNLIFNQLVLRGTETGLSPSGQPLFLEFLDEASRRGGWPVPNAIWHGLFEEWKERGIV